MALLQTRKRLALCIGVAEEQLIWNKSCRNVEVHKELCFEMLCRGGKKEEVDEDAKADAEAYSLIERLRETAKLSASLGKCKRCGSSDLNVLEKQCRSGDEAATLFFTCNACSSNWRVG